MKTKAEDGHTKCVLFLKWLIMAAFQSSELFHMLMSC